MLNLISSIVLPPFPIPLLFCSISQIAYLIRLSKWHGWLAPSTNWNVPSSQMSLVAPFSSSSPTIYLSTLNPSRSHYSYETVSSGCKPWILPDSGICRERSRTLGDSLVVQCLGLHASTVGGKGEGWRKSSIHYGQWLNPSGLCGEASLKPQKDSLQRVSWLNMWTGERVTWRGHGNSPPFPLHHWLGI